jgi:hypothetical protein
MPGVQLDLAVHEVELDRNNPRIRRFLEAYEGDLTDDRIALALDVAGDFDGEAKGATTPEKLRNSILAYGGIMQPIIVNRKADGKLVCIEGNTRLYIYRQFHAEGVEGNWATIPAIVHEDLQSDGMDAIRLQAHLVGPRAWDAYSKAKYQYELHYKHLMPLDRLVELCGGDRRDVQKSIQAYADMENHYRKLHEPGEPYDTQRFSGFVELQNSKVKTAILKAGLNLDNFAEWIKDGRIGGLATVRQLPRVLAEKTARGVFLKKGIKAALDTIEKPEVSADLRNATISQLARAITEKIETLPYAEVKRLQANPDDDAIRYILDALDALRTLTADINQQSDVG